MHLFQCFGALELALFLAALQCWTAAQLSVEIKVSGSRRYLLQDETASDFLYCFALNGTTETVKLFLQSDVDGSFVEVNKYTDPRYSFNCDFSPSIPANVSCVYSVQNVQANDGGSYTCKATDENALSANLSVYIPVYDAPLILKLSTSPPNGVVLENSNFSLIPTVQVPPMGNSDLLMEWQRNGEIVASKDGLSEFVYGVLSAAPNDSGVYSFVVKNGTTEIDRKNSPVPVDVQYKAKVTEFSAFPSSAVNGSTVVVTEKDNVDLYCFVDGNPLPSSTTIQKSSSLEISAMKTVYRVFYNITSVSRKDNGTYKCTTSNVVGNSEVNLYLNVQYEAYINSFSVNGSVPKKMEGGIVYMIAGADASFECIAEGNPTPYMTLVHQSSHDNETLIEKRQKTVSAKISDVQSVRDDGLYICSASNHINATAYSTISFRVYEKPQIVFFGLIQLHDEQNTSNSSCQRVSSGVRLQLQCVSHGKPDPRVLILNPNKDIVANASLTANYVFTSGLAENGTYQCLAQSLFSAKATYALCIASSHSDSSDLTPLICLVFLIFLLCVIVDGRNNKQRCLSRQEEITRRGLTDSGHVVAPETGTAPISAINSDDSNNESDVTTEREYGRSFRSSSSQSF